MKQQVDEIVLTAPTLTGKSNAQDATAETARADSVIKFCYQARHFNIFGHAALCARFTGVSRNFMSQITRHNHTIFTCSSQHYQDYRGYPLVSFLNDDRVREHYQHGVQLYSELVDGGVKPEDAREVLPACAGVNMLMTCNAIQWAHIMRERLCNRNVYEMRVWAQRIMDHLTEWFPQLFRLVGPQCLEGGCLQGKMQCEERHYERA